MLVVGYRCVLPPILKLAFHDIESVDMPPIFVSYSICWYEKDGSVDLWKAVKAAWEEGMNIWHEMESRKTRAWLYGYEVLKQMKWWNCLVFWNIIGYSFKGISCLKIGRIKFLQQLCLNWFIAPFFMMLVGGGKVGATGCRS
jgi:hypothetical protein